jgi:UDP-N-acetylglucosamine--N-acetylmuramyl-(pentapeptide) pyrophosphoryl-undecaprenol N-acetylglucosamine transferase
MKDFDLIVSRAGASSVAEITSLRLPSILIPSPYVANNHQFYNAESIVKSGAGYMIEEHDLNADILNDTINEIINDDNKIKDIKSNLDKIAIDDSATIIYENIKKLI